MGNDYMSSNLNWEMRDEARSAGLLAKPYDNDRDYPDPQENPYARQGCRCAGSETGPCEYCEWEPDEADIIVRCFDCRTKLNDDEQCESKNDGKIRCGDCDDEHNKDWFDHSEPEPSLADKVTQIILDTFSAYGETIVESAKQHTTDGRKLK